MADLDLRRGALVALLGGASLTAALPPFGWWPLGLLGTGLLAVAVAGRAWRGRLAVGAAAAAGFLGPGLFWMTEFSAPGFVAAVVIEASILTAGVLAVPAATGRRWPLLLGIPGTLVLVEGLRGIWPFGGVPIATLAQTQVGGPLATTVRVGGPLLLAALVALTGTALALALRPEGRRAAAGALGVVALVAAGGWAAPNGSDTGELRVAMVQGGGERGTLAVETSSTEVFERHLAITEEVGDVDLVVWPEDILKVEGDVTDAEVGRVMGRLARQREATFVVGSAEGVGDRFRVVSTAWGPDGEPVDRYHKNLRVPFGEYVPFRPLVERLADVSPIPRDALEGEGIGLLVTPAGDLGVAVSFEVFFAHLTRSATTAGAEVILVPTNAASYSTTQMPALQLGATRLRALETGRWIVQAAPTGFSAIVDPDGRVTVASDLGEGVALEGMVATRRGLTPYGRTGDVPWVAFALAAVAAAWVTGMRSGAIGWRGGRQAAAGRG
ncbi:MAG TPA: apolipoprotein N-acyltransferase [Acidimicrobiales bacterium]|nr:apolipoprotein N-acyltransferase [Acidimicrobiales bacterium]